MLSDDAQKLAALAEQFPTPGDERDTADAIVAYAVEVVPDAEHVSVTVKQRNGCTTLSSSSPLAERLDQLQYELGEGPCVTAADDGSWDRSGHVASDGRWPVWGPNAAAEGVGSFCSVRLMVAGETIGALNMYAHTTGAFSDTDVVDLALVYATYAAQALASAKLIGGLSTAIDSRHTIGLAQGMLMERYGLDAARSFALLNRHSQQLNRKLRDIAAELVATGTIPVAARGVTAEPDSQAASASPV